MESDYYRSCSSRVCCSGLARLAGGGVCRLYGPGLDHRYNGGSKQGEWSFSVARAGCWHKIGSAVAVIVALIFDWLIAMILANIPGITLPFTYEVFLGPVVLVWYIVTELGSITENAGALGAPIPDFLRAAIKSLNQAVDGSDAKD